MDAALVVERRHRFGPHDLAARGDRHPESRQLYSKLLLNRKPCVGAASPAWGRYRPWYSAESRTEFADDSSLEGTGFELLVPRHESPRFPKHPCTIAAPTV